MKVGDYLNYLNKLYYLNLICWCRIQLFYGIMMMLYVTRLLQLGSGAWCSALPCLVWYLRLNLLQLGLTRALVGDRVRAVAIVSARE